MMVLAVAYTLRRLKVGALDAVELASKAAVPHPRSARDWPEVRLSSVISGPEDDVIVLARWPGRPDAGSSLVLRPDEPDGHATRLLERWCDRDTSLSPMAWGDSGIALRPRGTMRRVRARILAEDLTPGATST
jgi:hypothetical protein